MKNLLVATVSTLLASSLAAQTNVCSTAIGGIGCGPHLGVTFTPVGLAGNNTITVDVSGLDPAGIGLMAWGLTPINVPIWGGCNAYTDYIWGHVVNPDAAGEWSWSRSWPNSVQNSYRIQVAGLGLDTTGNLAITLTDCVVATCTQ
ncbi:MAG TPA: hypothetical protein VFZ65_06940 [Planctomycetota bacterium]|nr:hypothetical protein [Planctomycetota bacterium]